uniref:Putative rdx family n=1 Tax=Amblyomma cajennense TaxID=34607 RepID=A0A023FMU1_AMBCJ
MRLAPRFEELKRQILAKLPNATVTGNVGRTSSFEVEINGVKVYSKLEKGAFPDFAEVVHLAIDASNGMEVKPCTKTGSRGLCILL